MFQRLSVRDFQRFSSWINTVPVTLNQPTGEEKKTEGHITTKPHLTSAASNKHTARLENNLFDLLTTKSHSIQLGEGFIRT